jgi:hypothetical protein
VQRIAVGIGHIAVDVYQPRPDPLRRTHVRHHRRRRLGPDHRYNKGQEKSGKDNHARPIDPGNFHKPSPATARQSRQACSDSPTTHSADRTASGSPPS